MIFREELLPKVLDGSKTVTRRPVKLVPNLQADGWDGQRDGMIPMPCKYRVGKTYAVQPGRGKKAVARIRILDVRIERSFGAVSCEWGGLRREGFKHYAEFEACLRRLYGEVPVGPVHRIEFELVTERRER